MVRPAGPEDFDAVATLLAELGRPEVTAATRDGAREVYLRHVARADTASLVAEAGGEVVGFMSLEFRERLNRTTPQAWIPDLIVSARRRGIGAGKALLLKGFEIARERGCWGVTLESGYQRKVAHEVYRRVGMEACGFYFELLPGER